MLTATLISKTVNLLCRTATLLCIFCPALVSLCHAGGVGGTAGYTDLKYQVSDVAGKRLFVAASDSCTTIKLELDTARVFYRSLQENISVCRIGTTSEFYGFYNKPSAGHPDGFCGSQGVEQDLVLGSLDGEKFRVSIDRIVSSCFCNDSLPKLGVKVGKRIALRNEVLIKQQNVPLVRFKKNSKYMRGPVVIESEYAPNGKLASEAMVLGPGAKETP